MSDAESDAMEAKLRHVLLDPQYADLWRWQTAAGGGAEFWWDFRGGLRHVTLKQGERVVCASAETIPAAIALALESWGGKKS